MLGLRKLREVIDASRTTYASKAMHWIGTKLILNGNDVGLPGDFYWDQEDRAVLKGKEVNDPRYQRLQVRTDDFRRYLTYGIGRFMPVVIPLLVVPILMVGYLAVKFLGPDLSGETDTGTAVEAATAESRPVSEMQDQEIAWAVQQMSASGKTEQTLNSEERAIVAEARRRQLMH